MNAEMKNAAVKATKIAVATCVALGGAALIASGAALKAVAEGGKYLADAVKKIIEDDPAPKTSAEEVVEEPEDPVPEAQEEAPAAKAAE